jgi:hypothetical protein
MLKPQKNKLDRSLKVKRWGKKINSVFLVWRDIVGKQNLWSWAFFKQKFGCILSQAEKTIALRYIHNREISKITLPLGFPLNTKSFFQS